MAPIETNPYAIGLDKSAANYLPLSPMAGAVLNAINIRLDAATIAFILKHGEA